jgi:hypothetical protein
VCLCPIPTCRCRRLHSAFCRQRHSILCNNAAMSYMLLLSLSCACFCLADTVQSTLPLVPVGEDRHPVRMSLSGCHAFIARRLVIVVLQEQIPSSIPDHTGDSLFTARGCRGCRYSRPCRRDCCRLAGKNAAIHTGPPKSPSSPPPS